MFRGGAKFAGSGVYFSPQRPQEANPVFGRQRTRTTYDMASSRLKTRVQTSKTPVEEADFHTTIGRELRYNLQTVLLATVVPDPTVSKGTFQLSKTPKA